MTFVTTYLGQDIFRNHFSSSDLCFSVLKKFQASFPQKSQCFPNILFEFTICPRHNLKGKWSVSEWKDDPVNARWLQYGWISLAYSLSKSSGHFMIGLWQIMNNGSQQEMAKELLFLTNKMVQIDQSLKKLTLERKKLLKKYDNPLRLVNMASGKGLISLWMLSISRSKATFKKTLRCTVFCELWKWKTLKIRC